MGLVTIALLIVAVWIGVLVVVLALCKASAHADADAERYVAEERDVPNQSLVPHSDATVGDERRSIDRAELDRGAERSRIGLPDRPSLRRTRLVGTRRHRS